MPSATKDGYHAWAVPYVSLMRKNKIATAITIPFATGRYQYLSGKWSLAGWFTVAICEPICWVIGKLAGTPKSNTATAVGVA
jgi:hypothetical protein